MILARPLDRRWLAAAVALLLLDIALHLPIEDLFDEIARRYGFFWYDALAQKAFIAAGLAVVGALWWTARPGCRILVRRATLVVVGAMLLSKAFLLVLNAIGALLGVIAVLAWSEREPEPPLVPSSTASRLVLLALVAASIFGPVFRTPFYNTTPGGRHFHLLTWFETAVILGGLWAAVRRLAASGPTSIKQA